MAINSAYHITIKNDNEIIEQVISLDYNTGINYIEQWAEKCKARLTKLCSAYGLITIEIPKHAILFTHTLLQRSVYYKNHYNIWR